MESFKIWLENQNEKIVQTAFKVGDNIYPSGPVHNSSVIPDAEYDKEWISGFLTNIGRFLNRREAALFASGKIGGTYRSMDSTELKNGPIPAYN